MESEIVSDRDAIMPLFKKKKISYLGLLHPQCPQEPGFTFGFESYYHYYQ